VSIFQYLIDPPKAPSRQWRKETTLRQYISKQRIRCVPLW